MTAALELTTIGLTFLLAGAVKGVIGLGLPTVSLAVLTVALGLQPAMALLLVPSLATNFWQAAVGGHLRTIVARIWPLLLLAAVTVWIGAGALTRIDIAYLSALLGLLIALYAAVSLAGFRPRVSARRQVWAGPLVGAVNGVLTGMTGSFVFPGVLYLQALGLPRDALIQAMGMLFTVSTAALGVALAGRNLVSADLGAVSTAAVAPALLGMAIGRRLSRAMSDELFRRVFFTALLALGLYIVARSGL